MPVLALLVIAFFVNVPLVAQGPVHLWHAAPALVVLTAVIDLFLLGVTGITLRRRHRDAVRDSAA